MTGPFRERTGISLGIAGLLVVFFMILPALLAFFAYAFLMAYALVKAIGSAPQDASGLTVLLFFGAIVGVLVLLIALVVALIGRDKNKPLRPKWLGGKARQQTDVELPPTS
jgi:hypothetical protein